MSRQLLEQMFTLIKRSSSISTAKTILHATPHMMDRATIKPAQCHEGQCGVHAVDHGDLASAEVVGLTVRHGHLDVVTSECR